MVDAIDFPRELLREQSGRWSLRGAVIAGGQTGIGALPRARMDGGGVWQAQYDQINLREAAHVRLWREHEWKADNGVQPLVVPLCDARQAAPIASGVPHSDGALFGDGVGYSYGGSPVTIGANAALRATTLTLTAAEAAVLVDAGQFFSIEHAVQGKRLYGIRSIESRVGLNTVVTIRPPLRQAVTAGDAIVLDDLGCVMVLQTADAMDLTLIMRRFAAPSATFVEYFYPPA